MTAVNRLLQTLESAGPLLLLSACLVCGPTVNEARAQIRKDGGISEPQASKPGSEHVWLVPVQIEPNKSFRPETIFVVGRDGSMWVPARIRAAYARTIAPTPATRNATPDRRAWQRPEAA